MFLHSTCVHKSQPGQKLQEIFGNIFLKESSRQMLKYPRLDACPKYLVLSEVLASPKSMGHYTLKDGSFGQMAIVIERLIVIGNSQETKDLHFQLGVFSFHCSFIFFKIQFPVTSTWTEKIA